MPHSGKISPEVCCQNYFITTGCNMHQLSVTDIQKILALNIRKRRKQLGYTQMQLAEQCNVSTSFIGEIELCKKFPSAVTLQKLVDVLHISPSTLFFDEYNLVKGNEARVQNLCCEKIVKLKQEIEEIFNTFLQELDTDALKKKNKHKN